MTLKAKRFLVSLFVLLIALVVVLFYQVFNLNNENAFIKKDYEETVESYDKTVSEYKRTIEVLEKDNEYFFKQYRKYFELSEELQNQMGVYYDY